MQFAKHVVAFLLPAVAFLGIVSPAAALEPEEVAVLYAGGNQESKELALHYAKARGIPERENVFSVEVPSTEGEEASDELDRSAWEEKVRPAILEWLERNDPNRKLRCIVTCRGIPARIGKRDPTSTAMTARTRFLRESRRRRVAKANGLVKAFEEMLGRKLTRSRPVASTATSKEVADRLETVISNMQQYAQSLPTAAERQQILVAYERFLTAAGGMDMAAKMVASRVTEEALKTLDPRQSFQIGMLAGRGQGLNEALRSLNNLPDSVARDVQVLNLTETTKGIVGTIMWIDEEQRKLRENRTESSFDSELSLIYWPEHPLFEAHPNVLAYTYDTVGVDKSRQMMVARLSAPTLDQAKAMVDSAIAAEREGLKGKMYVDARGLAPDAQTEEDGPFVGQFDQSLRDLAARLKAAGTIEVVLDDEGAVFGEGACPDAALYCGWLGEKGYTGSFTWVPGAVGYHLAKDGVPSFSREGVAWCNGMIQNGVAATVGPVYETNLEAFPLPDLFFSTLLTGEYTLVETYYRTKPFNSWMMVLVGDPLYNPFKNNPLLTKDRLPDVLDPEKRQAAQAAAQAAAQGGQPAGAATGGGASTGTGASNTGADDLPAIEGAEKVEGTEKKKEEEFDFQLPGLDDKDKNEAGNKE